MGPTLAAADETIVQRHGGREALLADFDQTYTNQNHYQRESVRLASASEDARGRKQGDGARGGSGGGSTERAPRRARASAPVWVRVILPVDR